jgi:hypothetical protein
MFSPAKAITAAALVFGIGGVLLIAQPFGRQGPSVPNAATEAALQVPVIFTGQIECGPAVGTMTWRNSATVSDPRLTGDAFRGSDSLGYSGPGPSGEDGDPVWMSAQVWGETMRIENDEGAWQGSATTATLDGDSLVATFVLTGEGAYQGFTALMEERFVNNGNCIVPDDRGLIYSDVRGIIFEGQPPAAPELNTWE